MIVVTGSTGQLGAAFERTLDDDAVFLSRSDLDLGDPTTVASAIVDLRPSSVINCAAYTDVDAAESDESTATIVNGIAVGALAGACREVDARFMTFSTDYVFDGSKSGAYVESDEPAPINAYGRSKLLGELLASEANPDALVVRTSWLLSSTHPNFVRTVLRRIRDEDMIVVDDQRGRPTVVDDLVVAVLDVMERGMTGVLHLTGDSEMTWYDLARLIATTANMDPGRVHPCSTEDFPRPAPRPRNSVLESERLEPGGVTSLHGFERSLERVVRGIVPG